MCVEIFRPAMQCDLVAIRRIVERRPKISIAVDNWIDRSWVYLKDGEVIAFASRGISSHQLQALYVIAGIGKERLRGHGYGSKFLTRIEGEMKIDSAFIELFVAKSNPKAKRFYMRNGYQPSRAAKGWIMRKFFREVPSLEEGRPI